MNTLFKTSLTLCMAAILSACTSNKGSFDLTDVAAPKVSAPTTSQTPKYEDVKTEPRPAEEVAQLQQPALGFEMKSVRRNWHPRNKVERVPLASANIHAIGGELSDVPHLEELKKLSYKGEVSYVGDNQSPFTKRDFKYIQAGYALTQDAEKNFDYANQIAENGAVGYLFYKGIQPASALPTGQVVKYHGTWDFMTDAVDGRAGIDSGYAGNRYSAFSADDDVHRSGQETYVDAQGNQHIAPIGHSSEFDVDFDQKTLSGKLYRNPHTQHEQAPKPKLSYEINAKLYGNRFRGEAQAANQEDEYLGKSSSTLEGGFYGANAEELAGKFLTDDNSLFAVFGAKQTGETVAPTQAAFDAKAIVSNTQTADFHEQPLTQFGQARQLIIDGKSFSLLPELANVSASPVAQLEQYTLPNGDALKIHVCCNQLDYVKYGRYFRGDGYRDATYFLTGERTPIAEMPASGFVRYQGTWDGEIKHNKTGASWYADAKDSPAIFNVDFDQKTIQGVFNADNRIQPVLTLDGKVQGNGFTGTAKTAAQGFNIDPGNTLQSNVVHLNTSVQGGFYGPNANELGGTMLSSEADKDKIGATFGAKRQQVNQ